MAVRDILIWPNKKLSDVSLAVEKGQNIDDLVQDLTETMESRDGAGIAAPQIGENVGVFLIAPQIAGIEGGPQIFVNPELTWVSDEKTKEMEGCLSFPDIWIHIERPEKCKMRATNKDGEEFEVEADGIYARALQHEFDHLNGTLMTDFVGPLKRKMVRKKMTRKRK
jgi:peptide deformylase